MSLIIGYYLGFLLITKKERWWFINKNCLKVDNLGKIKLEKTNNNNKC